jgi:HK97 family phage portal protein
MRFWPFSRKSLAAPDADLASIFGVSLGTASGVSVSAESALRVPAVAAAIKLISETVACLDLNVVAIADDGSETVDRSHAAAALLNQPNDWTSGKFELIRGLLVDALTRDVGGLAYVNRVDGKPVEILKYRPGVIGVDLTADTGEPSYKIGALTVSPGSVIHVRNAFDRSPITLAREAIGVALILEAHAARLFGSGAKPGGIISTPKSVGDDGVKRMLAGWRAAHEGADKAGKTAILWDGATWTQLSLSSVDSQFQELRVFAVLEIARAFSVPPSMIGDLSRATWSNSEQMARQFLATCAEPWLQAVEAAFRRALFLPDERKKYAVRFDRDDFSNVDLTARATAINSLISSRVINPNEARSWLGGLAPYEGGDEFANPNTGASQPGGKPPVEQPEEESDDDA